MTQLLDEIHELFDDIESLTQKLSRIRELRLQQQKQNREQYEQQQFISLSNK